MAAAKQSAYMSNPNIDAPTGSQRVTWTKSPTVDTDAYNKALQAYQDRIAQYGPEYAGETPDQSQFTTFIEQPTITQTIDPNALAALRSQERAQLELSRAAEGAAGGLKNLGIASAFSPQNLPSLGYDIGSSGAIQGAPQGIYAPLAGYGQEALPGQVTAGQQATVNLPVQGASTAQNQFFGLAQGGPAAPTNLGTFDAGQFTSQTAPSGQAFGTAQGGPSGGLYGMAGAGPQGLNLQGLDLSGIGGVAGGPQQGQFGYAQQFVGGPQLQSQIDIANLPQGPVNAGMTAQTALLSRLSPQLQGERQQLQTQLINQGLRPGGEAYNSAMSAQMQKENDLLLQAAAQGISLDQAARQQAFGEQQSRAMFANQAALSGFGAGMEQAQLYNTGLGQNFQQSLATQAAQNQAQQQAFQQRLQGGEFGREAQLASFGTQQQAQEAANQAIAQNFAQGQAAQQMQNQAIGQNFEQALAAQQAQNAALGQNYQQALGAAGFNREGLMQQFGMGQSAQELANQALAQNYQTTFDQARAQNEALQQIFQQGATQQQMYNQAAAQNFQQQVAAQQANLARQAQQVGQSQSAAGFYNEAQSQAMQQELSRQAAANAAQQQQFQQNIAQQQFRNTAIQQALAQQAAIRSIPVNEISALLSGGQVNVPQFQGYQGVTVAPAPIFQGGQAQDAAAMQRYGIAANQAASNAGGLFNLAGSLGSAAIMASDRRLKSNIVRLGTHPLGIGIYAYDIFGERQLGVMADEVEQVKPEAVLTHSSGFKMVNYGAL